MKHVLQMEAELSAAFCPYAPGTIALATKHFKEEVIAPTFAAHLGSALYVPKVDTDVLGTFTGEIERRECALQTAVKKAQIGMALTRLPCGLGSEGSFIGHPFIPHTGQAEEVMVFIDTRLHLQIHETLITAETNYACSPVSSVQRALEFAGAVQFPGHGVIVSPAEVRDPEHIYKDACTLEQFEASVANCLRLSPVGLALLCTDMRAHRNPTRMRVIGQLAERLAKRLATPCPACRAPGWGVVQIKRGLPCGVCGAETRMEAGQKYGCARCDYQEHVHRSDGLTQAPPGSCDHCNP